MSGWKELILNTCLLGTIGCALLQGVLSAQGGGLVEKDLVKIPAGRRLDVQIAATGTNETLALSDVGKGSCTYLVVYSPTCGASATTARQWAQDLERTGGPASLPSGWKFGWISGTETDARPDFLPADFPVAVYRAAESRLPGKIGVRAYPAHIILDSAGRVVEADVGAPLYPSDSYLPNCRISRPDASAQPEER